MLLNSCTKLADRDGAKVYIEASAIGKVLYERLGWKMLQTAEAENNKAGVKCMMREARVPAS